LKNVEKDICAPMVEHYDGSGIEVEGEMIDVVDFAQRNSGAG